MPSQLYRSALNRQADTGLLSGTLRVLLVDDAYTFNVAHIDVADVNANEVAATGYARQNAAAPTQTQNGEVLEIDFAAIDFGALGGASNDTIGGAILYDETGAGDADYELIAFFDTNDLTTNGGNVTFAPADPSITITRTLP